MNKKLFKNLFLVAFLLIMLFSLTGCSVTDLAINKDAQEETSIEGLPVYASEEDANFKKHEESNGITFSYPSTWVSIGTSSQPVYMSDSGNGSSVNLVSEAKPDMISFSGYVDASIVNLKKQVSLIGDVQKEAINLNGKRAYKLSYEFSEVQDGQTFEFAITQVILQKDNTCYILSVASLKENAETEKPTLDKIIKSFNY